MKKERAQNLHNKKCKRQLRMSESYVPLTLRERRNEAKLNEAFFSAEKVYLIFSVNMSHHFQGYARMFSPIGYGDKPDWCGDVGVGGSFKIRWQSLYDLPFRETGHLTNPLNENKVVKISRDGQEMAEEVGDKLLVVGHHTGAGNIMVVVERVDTAGGGPGLHMGWSPAQEEEEEEEEGKAEEEMLEGRH
eukprot:gene14707-17381_t